MKTPTILITDDESGIRLVLRTALESDGFRVIEAANGVEALEAIVHQNPDLVVLDLNMPVMDGMAVLERLRAIAGPKPRVIILTAYGSVAAAVKATRLGAVDFLEKPITPSDLRQTVRSVLEEPELDSPPPVEVNIPGGYDQVLERIRIALHAADLDGAQALLETASQRRNQQAAEYFNLLGVLYEAQRQWRLARKCYGRAIATEGKYQPAQANMRRLYELHTFGKSSQPVVLGMETEAEKADPCKT
jgi:two-component system, OmpR family, alkaline phosphatase synthesis response regulator PhoP